MKFHAESLCESVDVHCADCRAPQQLDAPRGVTGPALRAWKAENAWPAWWSNEGGADGRRRIVGVTVCPKCYEKRSDRLLATRT